MNDKDKLNKKINILNVAITIAIVIFWILLSSVIWNTIRCPIAKPIIYLYPTEETNVTIKF